MLLTSSKRNRNFFFGLIIFISCNVLINVYFLWWKFFSFFFPFWDSCDGSDNPLCSVESMMFCYMVIFCSVDLKGLMDQNKQNLVPPSSRMTNYVVLRFGNANSDPNVSVSSILSCLCVHILWLKMTVAIACEIKEVYHFSGWLLFHFSCWWTMITRRIPMLNKWLR